MNLFLMLAAWVVLLLVCWPVAILLLLLVPLLWLLALPFRLAFILVEAVLALLKAIVMLPARLFGHKSKA